ncbi:MAG: carboxymuconolactone decarboxylase family protein [Acidobacteria bacterium]|nr:carboxymuconolactone decarboxylase family protein [Acidobacteriota bacterium]
MKTLTIVALIAAFAVSGLAQKFTEANNPPAAWSLVFLESAARRKALPESRARVALAEAVEIKNADALESGGVPNYIRAMAQNTKAAPQFANLVQTFLFGGTVAPETKMAMGLRIAQLYGSGYLYAHTARWLRASAKGQSLLKDWEDRRSFSDAEKTALEYAEKLTGDIHGVSEEDFARARGFYNDSQLIELTMTVCFFNHFVRFVEATGLPVEDWVLNDKAPKFDASVNKTVPPPARVALVSDGEMTQAQTILETAKKAQTENPRQSLGLGIANSQRAFLRVPALGQAWRDFGFQNRASWTIDRSIQLQISFAVSMANGCRYCTLHQVLGLRRLGVDPKKLLAMKKDDSALTPRELTAVEFARKLTKQPASVTDADFEKLKKEFGEQGAVEVVLQTGAFAFMNRFTDGLRLPSEDEAVKTYQEVYGDGAYRDWKLPK